MRRFETATGDMEEQRSNIRPRYSHPMEMRCLLNQQGFDVVAIDGNWNASPVTTAAYDMVVVGRRH